MSLLLVVVMVFTGCATIDSTTVINSDGTAKITQTIELEKTETDKKLKEANYSDPLVALNTYGMMSGLYFKVVTKDGKQYYQATETKTIKKAENLSPRLTEDLAGYYSDFYATADTVYGVIDGSEMMNGDLDYFASNVDLKTSLNVSYTFVFSANVVNTTGTISKDNPKQVTFSIPINGKATIFASTKSANTYEKVKAKVAKLNTVKSTKIKSLKVTKIKKNKGTVSLKYKKIKDASYEIEYSTSKKFNYSKTRYKYTKKTSVTLKKMKKGKKYYVRVRAVKYNYAGTYIHSKFVKKTITIK